jgi:8-oxo-dGTP pyrophosphatase MutT (NUDIX family)
MDHSRYVDEKGLRSPFYRVSAKAVVRDDTGRVLVCADTSGTYELPGGGWEHDETFEEAVSREIEEELGVKVTRVGGLQFTHAARGPRAHMMLRIAADVELASHDFTLDKNEVTATRFVGRDEFLKLDWCMEDKVVVNYVDKLWPPSA